eukprot:714798-Pyramimonas_sp.AAC.2
MSLTYPLWSCSPRDPGAVSAPGRLHGHGAAFGYQRRDPRGDRPRLGGCPGCTRVPCHHGQAGKPQGASQPFASAVYSLHIPMFNPVDRGRAAWSHFTVSAVTPLRRER